MKYISKLFLVTLTLLCFHSVPSSTFAAGECTGTYRFGSWNDNGSVCQLSSAVTQCNAFKDRQSCEAYKDTYTNAGSCAVGTCDWVDEQEDPNGPPPANPPSGQVACEPNNGSCMSENSSCHRFSTDYTCGGTNVACCTQIQRSCSDIDGARCVDSDTGRCDVSQDGVCGTGTMCCLNRDPDPGDGGGTQPDPGSGGDTQPGPGPSCQENVVEEFNQCGCSASGVVIPGNYSVKVTKYTSACTTGDQFRCNAPGTQCANGCNATTGACIDDGATAPTPTPKMCEPGKPAGSYKDRFMDRDSYAPQCKIVEEWYGPNCEILLKGEAGKPLDQQPYSNCDALGPDPSQTTGKLTCTLDAKIVDGDDIEVTIPKPSGDTAKYDKIRWRVGDSNNNYIRDEHTGAKPTVQNFYSHRDLPLGSYRVIAEFYPSDGSRPAAYCGEKWLTVSSGSSTAPSTGTTSLSFPSGKITASQSGGKVTAKVTSSDASRARIYMHKDVPLESSGSVGAYDPNSVGNAHYLLTQDLMSVTVDEPKQAGKYSVYANLEKSYEGYKSGTTDKTKPESIKFTGCSWNGKSYLRFYDDAVSFKDVNGFSLPQCNGTTGYKSFTVDGSSTQTISDVNFSSNKKDLASWQACYNDPKCTQDRTMDANSDGQVNILDYNYLITH